MLLTDLIPIGIIAFIAASLLIIVFHRETLHTNRRRAFCLFLARFLGLWYAIAAVALLFKTRIFLLNEPGNPFDAVNIVPFKTIAEYVGKRNWIQIWGNMLVFFPFPALLRLNFPRMKSRNFLLTVLSVTVLIEPVQILINVLAHTSANVIDVDDFLLNAAGCLLGLVALKLLSCIARRKKRA